jgi:nicotinamide-nucleotide amidase
MLTEVPGSSRYFWGGVIAYDNRIKIGLLDVTAEDLETGGAVSHAVAQQMAAGVRERLGTSWGLSITGIAGPDGGTVDKPIGLVYVGLASSDGSATSREYQFGKTRGRDWIRHVSACSALDFLRNALLRCN